LENAPKLVEDRTAQFRRHVPIFLPSRAALSARNANASAAAAAPVPFGK